MTQKHYLLRRFDWYVNSDMYEAEVKAKEKRKAEPTSPKVKRRTERIQNHWIFSSQRSSGRIMYILLSANDYIVFYRT